MDQTQHTYANFESCDVVSECFRNNFLLKSFVCCGFHTCYLLLDFIDCCQFIMWQVTNSPVATHKYLLIGVLFAGFCIYELVVNDIWPQRKRWIPSKCLLAFWILAECNTVDWQCMFWWANGSYIQELGINLMEGSFYTPEDLVYVHTTVWHPRDRD